MANKKWFGINGSDHGVYALISHLIFYFTVPYYIWLCFIINTIVWFGFEFSQEKAMGRGLEFKPWKWSKSRMQDMGIPFAVGLIFMGITYA